MEITNVKINLVKTENLKLKGYAHLELDHQLVIHNMKIIEGKERIFVAMPTEKNSDGSFKDVVHPIKRETRQMIEQKVLEEYAKIKEELK